MTTLVQNTLKTIKLNGAIVDAEGRGIPLEFQRAIPEHVAPPTEPIMNPHPQLDKNEPPHPKPLNLPPPADLALELKLVERLGRGRVGVVHAVQPDFSSLSTSSDLCSNNIPQLVVKVIHDPDKSQKLDREAWFYDYLRSLQGSVIPLCFGYFEADIPEGVMFSDALKDTKYGHLTQQGTIRKRRNASIQISLLLLERLSGELLPSGPPTNSLIDEIKNLYQALTLAGVEHPDCRRENILKVLPDAKARKLPHTDATSSYRIVDLEGAERHKYDPAYFWNSQIENVVTDVLSRLEEY